MRIVAAANNEPYGSFHGSPFDHPFSTPWAIDSPDAEVAILLIGAACQQTQTNPVSLQTD